MSKRWLQKLVGATVLLTAAFLGFVVVDSLSDAGPGTNVVAGPTRTTEVLASAPTSSIPLVPGGSETSVGGEITDQAAASSRAAPAASSAVAGGNGDGTEGEGADGAAAGGDGEAGGATGGEVDSGAAAGDGTRGIDSGAVFEGLRNVQAKFSRFADVPSVRLDLDALTGTGGRRDNGTVGDGQFRLACEYSHFSYDDPIVFPGDPGRSHLHMFFGNTITNAFTTTETLVDQGGGTCNGFELNRSAYWTPALLDGQGNVVVPDAIILYYKSKIPEVVQPMPQGLKIVAGNVADQSFSASGRLHWSCGSSGAAYNLTNRIPDCGGDTINATIQFPNCWDGVNLDSPDHFSHMTFAVEKQPCPASHPVRLPQISFLLYYPGAPSVDGWHLSSDRQGGRSTGPGESLHADWWGGWNDEAVNLWTDGCMRAARNCSYGQTGTDRPFAPLNARQVYEGPNYLALPEGSYPR